MSAENGRVPRPGTIRAEALQAFESREPRAVIGVRTGRSREAVNQAIRDVRETYVNGGPDEPAFKKWLEEQPNTTTAGFSFYSTPEYKGRMSESRNGHRGEILPLLYRGASIAEIMYITGLTDNSVRAVKHREKKLDPLPSQSEDTRQIIRIRNRKIMRVLRGNRSVGPFNDLDFAKKLYEAGFVTDDLTNWQKLHELYQVNGRNLPESFADRVRLEVFWLGVEKALRGDVSLHRKYVELGFAVDADWFRESLVTEQGFIYRALHRRYLGERAMTDGNGATYEQDDRENDLRR